jgi:hypothetical protein
VATRPGAGRGGRGSGRDGTVALNLGCTEDGPRRAAHLTWASIPGTDNAAERRFDADVVPPHGGQRLGLVLLSSLASCTSTQQPTIFYRIFYRIVRHRAFRGGRAQHGTVAKAQVSAPTRPEAISAVTPTKQLITRRSRVQIPPPPPSRERRPRSPTWAFRRLEGFNRCCGPSTRASTSHMQESGDVRRRHAGTVGVRGPSRLAVRPLGIDRSRGA